MRLSNDFSLGSYVDDYYTHIINSSGTKGIGNILNSNAIGAVIGIVHSRKKNTKPNPSLLRKIGAVIYAKKDSGRFLKCIGCVQQTIDM